VWLVNSPLMLGCLTYGLIAWPFKFSFRQYRKIVPPPEKELRQEYQAFEDAREKRLELIEEQLAKHTISADVKSLLAERTASQSPIARAMRFTMSGLVVGILVGAIKASWKSVPNEYGVQPITRRIASRIVFADALFGATLGNAYGLSTGLAKNFFQSEETALAAGIGAGIAASVFSAVQTANLKTTAKMGLGVGFSMWFLTKLNWSFPDLQRVHYPTETKSFPRPLMYIPPVLQLAEELPLPTYQTTPFVFNWREAAGSYANADPRDLYPGGWAPPPVSGLVQKLRVDRIPVKYRPRFGIWAHPEYEVFIQPLDFHSLDEYAAGKAVQVSA